MPDDPVGHKAAVRAAQNTQLICVNVRVSLQHLVSKSHQLIIIHASVFSPNIRPISAETIAATRICVKNKITLGRQELHFMVQDLSKNRFGTSMDGQESGILFSGDIIAGLDHKTVQLIFTQIEIKAFNGAQLIVFQPLIGKSDLFFSLAFHPV